MSLGVRLRDGIEVELDNGETVLFDGSGTAETTVLSHAHGDHLPEMADDIVASRLTADLAATRMDDANPTVTSSPQVTLHDAGHIAGSRAAELTDPETGRTYCYTGDCSTRDRFYLRGFDPVDADVLIIESTYGKPEYRFPPTDGVVREIRDWLDDTMEEVVLLFSYALGRAQKLQRILAGTARNRAFVTDAIADLNAVIASHLDVSFPARRYGSDIDLEPGDALVLPMQTSRLSWIEALIETNDAVTAGFSGWALDDSFVYRRGLDEGFVLSDHCDFDELVEVVRTVDPERVYTHHGFADAFATHLTTEYGYDTRALKKNQSTLGDYR
ncbi:MAG: MBL fold metallo-hydrolase RNA specificity domain-containing protein [Haloplanus sp.]